MSRGLAEGEGGEGRGDERFACGGSGGRCSTHPDAGPGRWLGCVGQQSP